jgi:FkbM family methyltransferase
MTSSELEEYLSTPSLMDEILPQLFRRETSITILDIGACEGEDSIRYARSFPNARIFSFEPLPANQELIRTHFERYEVKHAELIPLALSAASGNAAFHVSSGHPSNLISGKNGDYGNKSSSLLPPISENPIYGWIEFNKTISIPTTTLCEFCQKRGISQIDFIHMDVQGAELLVLQGSGKKLKDISTIWLEVSDEAIYQEQPVRSQVMSFMKEKGFILALETRREKEGDQFYVNSRHGIIWPWLLRLRFLQALGHLRFILGKWKSHLTPDFSRK